MSPSSLGCLATYGLNLFTVLVNLQNGGLIYDPLKIKRIFLKTFTPLVYKDIDQEKRNKKVMLLLTRDRGSTCSTSAHRVGEVIGWNLGLTLRHN